MGKKAKREPTPKRPPLDDDARWVLMGAAHQRWAERTQDNELAVIALRKALAYDLPCMKRSVTGERTPVDAAMWTPDRLMLWFGNDGLRVVDASVFPFVTNGNIYAPVMMVAEKAADLILGNAPLPPSEAPWYSYRDGSPLYPPGDSRNPEGTPP